MRLGYDVSDHLPCGLDRLEKAGTLAGGQHGIVYVAFDAASLGTPVRRPRQAAGDMA